MIGDIGTKGVRSALHEFIRSTAGVLTRIGIFCPDYTHGHMQVVKLDCHLVRCYDCGTAVVGSRINYT